MALMQHSCGQKNNPHEEFVPREFGSSVVTSPQRRILHPAYRQDIDGMRGIAVLSVVIFHAFPESIKGGFVGVDIFFVISGYLISTIIYQNLQNGTFSFLDFYARRIRRIFPALFLVLLVSYTLGWSLLLPDEYKQLGKHILSGAGFVSNFTFLKEIGYFDNSAETKPLLHLWSLGVEEQFYIIWPLLLFLAWRFKHYHLVIALGIFSLSFFLNINWIKSDPAGVFYTPQTRFWELMSGSILAWCMLNEKRGRIVCISQLFRRIEEKTCYGIRNTDKKMLFDVVSILGGALLVFSLLTIGKNFVFPGFWAMLPVFGATLVILAGADAWLNRRVLSARPLV